MKYKGAVSEDDLLAIHEEEAEASGLAVPKKGDRMNKGGRVGPRFGRRWREEVVEEK